MKECDLYPPVKAWLEALGCVVSAEVPFHGSAIDAVGVLPNDELICIELKKSLTWKVLYQAGHCQLVTRRSYCGVGSKPRPDGLEQAKKAGLGVLSIVGGVVTEVLAPTTIDGTGRNSMFADRYSKQILDRCKTGFFDGVGGIPQLLGDGPAQDCWHRVQEYKTLNPTATWRDIYKNVPNHYASYRSMQGALRTIGRMIADRVKRKERDVAENILHK